MTSHFLPIAPVLARLLSTSFVLAALANDVQAAAAPWKPEKHVEIIVGTTAGGGLDTAARLMQRIWQQQNILGTTSSVVNKPGGGGSLGLAYLDQHAGDAHFLMFVSNPLLTSHITGTSPLTYSDVSPLALLFNEYVGLAVAAGSDLKSGRDFLERVKKAPGSLTISMPGAPASINHLALGLALKAAGGDPRTLKLVVFPSSSEAKTALLGGHVNALVAPVSNLVPQVVSGDLRVIAVSAPARLGGVLATAPTWREQGVPAAVASWRGIVGPRGLSAAQVAYWENVLEKTVQAKDWQQWLESNVQVPDFKKSVPFHTHLAQEYQEMKALLTELGLVKVPK